MSHPPSPFDSPRIRLVSTKLSDARATLQLRRQSSGQGSVHNKLTQAGELLGIRLLDSNIVGPTPAFYSFTDDAEATFAA